MELRTLLAPAMALGLGAQLSRLVVPGRYRQLYVTAGKAEGVDPNLLHALAVHESHENADAIGPTNTNGTTDYGLFQINDSNFDAARRARGLPLLGIDASNWRDPGVSARAAARLLAANKAAAPVLSIFDQVAVYNAGFSSLDADPATPGKQLRPKLNAEGGYINQAYVMDVMAWYALVSLASLAPVKTPGWSATAA